MKELTGQAVYANVTHYEGEDLPVETAECVASWWIEGFDSWEETPQDRRDAFVRRRRECPCSTCSAWRRAHGTRRRKGGLP